MYEALSLHLLRYLMHSKRCRDGALYILLLYNPHLVSVLFGMPFLGSHIYFIFNVFISLIISVDQVPINSF